MCSISLRVCQRAIWGVLRKTSQNGAKSTSWLNLIVPFLSVRFQIPYHACLITNFLVPLSYCLDHYSGSWNRCSRLEMMSVPDSLGSTLSSSTISPFFTCHDKRPYRDELTIEQTVRCLETELGQPTVLMATDFSNPSHVHGCTDDSVLTGVSKYPTKPM